MQAFTKIVIVTLLFFSALAGCKPVVVSGTCSFCDKPQAINSTVNKYQPSQNNQRFVKHSIPTFVVDKDVALAFINIKKEFNFWTEDELRADFGSHQSLADLKIGGSSFAYNAVPGVLYHMRKVILNEGEQQKRPENRIGHVMDVSIEKESAGKTSITLTYWSKYNEDEIKQYDLWVKTKLEKALQLKLF